MNGSLKPTVATFLAEQYPSFIHVAAPHPGAWEGSHDTGGAL
jgi:hypothetical protein